MSQHIVVRSAPVEHTQARSDSSISDGVCLGPQEDFPSAVAGLELVALQVLHSRLCRQLDREYLTPEGPHPVTLDRHQKLTSELNTRETYPA